MEGGGKKKKKAVMRGIKPILDNITQYSISDDGSVFINFGKYKGRSLQDIYENAPHYFDTMLTWNNLSAVIRTELEKLEAQGPANAFLDIDF